jgi:hypothetical protein
MMGSLKRAKPMDIETWRDIVLSDRRQRIEAIADEHGDEIVIECRRLLEKRDVHALDAELTRIGHKP